MYSACLLHRSSTFRSDGSTRVEQKAVVSSYGSFKTFTQYHKHPQLKDARLGNYYAMHQQLNNNQKKQYLQTLANFISHEWEINNQGKHTNGKNKTADDDKLKQFVEKFPDYQEVFSTISVSGRTMLGFSESFYVLCDLLSVKESDITVDKKPIPSRGMFSERSISQRVAKIKAANIWHLPSSINNESADEQNEKSADEQTNKNADEQTDHNTKDKYKNTNAIAESSNPIELASINLQNTKYNTKYNQDISTCIKTILFIENNHKKTTTDTQEAEVKDSNTTSQYKRNELLKLLQHEDSHSQLLDSIYLAVHTAKIRSGNNININKNVTAHLRTMLKTVLAIMDDINIFPPAMVLRIQTLYIQLLIARLTVASVLANADKRIAALNALDKLKIVFDQLQVGLANSMNGMHKMSATGGTMQNSKTSIFLGEACAALANAGFIQQVSLICTILTGIAGGGIGAASSMESWNNKFANASLAIYSKYATLQPVAIEALHANPRYDMTRLINIAYAIEQVHNSLSNPALMDSAITAYHKLLQHISNGIEKKYFTAADMQQIVVIVKIEGQDIRCSLPFLLQCIMTQIEKSTQSNSENQSVTNGIQSMTVTILNQCYAVVVNIESTPYSEDQHITLIKTIQNVIHETDWNNQITSYTAIHKVLWILKQSGISPKPAYFLYYNFIMAIIEFPGLQAHRNPGDFKKALLIGLAVLLSNFGTLMAAINQLQSMNVALAAINILSFAAFNSLFFADSFGDPWRGKSTHNQTTTYMLALSPVDVQSSVGTTTNKINYITIGLSTITQANSFNDMQYAVNDCINNLFPREETQESRENIESTSKQSTISDALRKHYTKLILQQMVESSTMSKQRVLLVFELYQKLKNAGEDEEAKALLSYFYDNVLDDGKTEPEEYFYTAMRDTKPTAAWAMLDYIKCLAVINKLNDDDDKNTQAAELDSKLHEALTAAETDKLSAFHVLYKERLLLDLFLRLATGIVCFTLCTLLVAFLPPAAPFLIIVALIFTMTVKTLIDRKFTYNFSSDMVNWHQEHYKSLKINSADEASTINETAQSNQCSASESTTIAVAYSRLEKRVYDTASLMLELDLALKQVAIADNPKLIFMVLAQSAWREMLLRHQRQLIFYTIFGMIFSLVWTASSVPLLGAKLCIAMAVCFGLAEAVISAPRVDVTLYQILQKLPGSLGDSMLPEPLKKLKKDHPEALSSINLTNYM